MQPSDSAVLRIDIDSFIYNFLRIALSGFCPIARLPILFNRKIIHYFQSFENKCDFNRLSIEASFLLCSPFINWEASMTGLHGPQLVFFL